MARLRPRSGNAACPLVNAELTLDQLCLLTEKIDLHEDAQQKWLGSRRSRHFDPLPAKKGCASRTENGKLRIGMSWWFLRQFLNNMAQLRPYLNRKFPLESLAMDLQPISLISRAISNLIKSKARSTPACPATANG